MKLKKILLSLLVLFCIVGCGETEMDYENEENYIDFLKESFERVYDQKIVIDDDEEIDEGEHIMDLHLKEESDVKFQACTYWEVSSPIPSRHYQYSSNFDSVYSTKILKEHLGVLDYGKLKTDENVVGYTKECELSNYYNVFELDYLSSRDDLAEELYKIGQKNYLYSIRLDVEYNGEKQVVIIKDKYTKGDYLTSLNKLVK